MEEKKRKRNVKRIGEKMKKSKAKKWVKKYQKENPKAELQGYLFGKEILEKLCNYPGSEGLWIFKGLNDDNEECFVLFPADEEGNILDRKKIKSLGAAASSNEDEDSLDLPANNGTKCPPDCPGGI